MRQTAPTDPNLRKITMPSIVRISDAFRGTPLEKRTGTPRHKRSVSHYLFGPRQVQLILEL